MKKLIALLLALAMVLSLAACGGSTAEPEAATSSDTSTEEAAPAEDTADATEDAAPAEEGEAAEAAEGTYYERTGDYDTDSGVIYDNALSEFNEYYQKAIECTENNSQRYALMAIAEAKLLEAAVFMPTTSQGGAAQIGRVIPNTVSTVKWGGANDRWETMLVTTEMITSEDYQQMRDLYAELKGTGTYYESVKQLAIDLGYELKDVYNYAYSSDTTTWDLFAEWNATLYEPVCNTCDHLMQYDCENILQPGLAESYEVSDDGLVYTFHIRPGVMWVDSQGREIAELTAQDWVTAGEHLFACGSGIEELWTSSYTGIVGADEYYSGETTDFSTVGVEAVDDYTLTYTLSAPCPYFMTMLEYTTFMPICTSYLEQQGDAYGSDPDHIAYCGPYLITGFSEKNSIRFKANEAYWNADAVSIKELNWLYDDGSDPTKTYDDCIAGTTDATGLSINMIEIAKNDGVYDEYMHISNTDATAYLTYLNLNRQAFANYNDETKLVSEKTDEQNELSYAAVNNVHFRRAMTMAVDRVTYNTQVRGADLAPYNLVNSYTTGDFVSLEEDVTVDINGTETTFPAGTYYGEILQAQLDADEYPITAWDPTANDGLGGSTGYDGYYNPEAAAAELEIAIEELKAEGYEISPENPVVLEYPVWNGSEIYPNRANVYKQSIESVLGGCVQVNILTCEDVYDWYYAEYFCSTGAEMNFDVGDMTGWSPDYGDPSSMLGTFLDTGYCTQSLGLF